VILSRFLRTLLFGVSATDPATFVIAAGVLLSAAARDVLGAGAPCDARRPLVARTE
jgi:hypothetical protein